MNIHIKRDGLRKELMAATFASYDIGSHLYDLNDEGSDSDFLSIYVPSSYEFNSFAGSHHQLQYKDVESNSDLVFTTIHQFIRNIISGDSTINFELIHHWQMKNSRLKYLYDKRQIFHTYNVVRSYLGMARRDLKFVHKGATEREKNKTLLHVVRGYKFATDIMNDCFELEMEDLHKVKQMSSHKERQELMDYYSPLIDTARKELNSMLENKKIAKNLSVSDQLWLDRELFELMEGSKYTELRDKWNTIRANELLSLYYDANLNGINYD